MGKNRSREIPSEIEIIEISITKKQYEQKQANLIKALLEIADRLEKK